MLVRNSALKTSPPNPLSTTAARPRVLQIEWVGCWVACYGEGEPNAARGKHVND